MNIMDVTSVLDESLDGLLFSNRAQRNPGFLLLYLNEDLFQDDDDEVSELVCEAVDSGIQVVCVHERDSNLGGAPFDVFFSQTPQRLLDPPYQIFRDIAVPL